MTKPQVKPPEPPECFVIMPVSDPDSYDKGHFKHVFTDIFTPACAQAGYRAIRADDVKATNLIHLDVLQRLLTSPMVLCDLSSRNPNVMFELGLRQAFDKPVVLVQEIGTPKIFDIAPMRYTEYRKERVYHEVLEDQKLIVQALTTTREAPGDSVNSIVRILALTDRARLPDVSTTKDPTLLLIREELYALRSEVRGLSERSSVKRRDATFSRPVWHLRQRFEELGARVTLNRLDRPYDLAALSGFAESLDDLASQVVSAMANARTQADERELRRLSQAIDVMRSRAIHRHMAELRDETSRTDAE